MVEINWADVEEAQEGTDGDRVYPPIPADTYTCVVYSAKLGSTPNGEKIGIGYQVLDGEFSGRIVWDDLLFYGGAVNRCKLALSRLGVELKPSVSDIASSIDAMKEKPKIIIDVIEDSYIDKKTKEKVLKNAITYGGFHAYGVAETTTRTEPADSGGGASMPF